MFTPVEFSPVDYSDSEHENENDDSYTGETWWDLMFHFDTLPVSDNLVKEDDDNGFDNQPSLFPLFFLIGLHLFACAAALPALPSM